MKNLNEEERSNRERKRGVKKMKHIFKKLHFGSNHEVNRTNETPSPSSPSLPPTTSVHSPATFSSSSSSSPVPVTSSVEAYNNNFTAISGANRSDYFSSEEEFQVQLALAISASNSDQDKKKILGANFLRLERDRINSRREADEAAELLSRRYWDYNILDYNEKVVDGFYDLYGLSMDPACQGKMPSLADLQTNYGDCSFEVVLVNRAIDPALEELDQVSHCIALDCPTTDVSVLVQRLADLVTEHMGGPVRDANIMLATWMEKNMELRTSLHTSILPIGSLNIGLSRHRALLFKVLADNVRIPCRLVKGSHYTGIDDDAVNIIKLENEREFLVDLMAAPGTLIPADVLNIKDTSPNSYNPRLGKTQNPQTNNNLGVDFSIPVILHKVGNRKFIVDRNIPLMQNSSSENAELVPSLLSENSGEFPLSMCASSNGNSECVVPTDQSHPFSSSVVGTSSRPNGKQGGLTIDDVVKENYNIVPNSANTKEESKNLFADLNPFQMIEFGRASNQNKTTNNKVNNFQKQGESLGPGRPPLALAFKNRSTYNEVPRTKQYEFVEGLLPRKNQEVKHYNESSLGSSSSDTLDKGYPEDGSVNVNISCISNLASASNGNRYPSNGGDSVLALSTNQYHELPSVDGNQTAKSHLSTQAPVQDYREDFHRDEEVLQKGIVNDTNENGKSVLGKHNHRKCTHDKFMGTLVMSNHLENSISQVGFGPSRLDPMLEDVAEWEIPWEDLVIGERIGLGSYGEVFHADWEGREVAVKKFLDQDFSGDALDEFRSEVRIMRRLRHPNVVRFLGAVTRPPNLSIITEFLPRGSVYRILHRPNSYIDEKHRIKMALDVAKGMNCLHTSIPTVVHRDLKSPNLLVDNNWNVKVCDFGLSRLKHNTFLSSKSTAGTPEWMAPEVLRNEPSNEKCDVYSFGVILWELATLRMPWTGLNPMQVVGAVGFQNRRLDIPKDVDPLIARIIWECWQTDPNLRPSFAQLTTALNPLQRLIVPSQQEQLSSHLPQEISVNTTP